MNRKEEYLDERWKKRATEIRKLDHHTCAMCGANDVELQVHHLSYPPPPFHIWDATDNELVTLCKDCHAKVHRSINRPTLDEGRNLNGCTVDLSYGDCYTCRRFVQQQTLEEYEICKNPTLIGCAMFCDMITCEKCVFLSKCRLERLSTIACEEYIERKCLHCFYFQDNTNESEPSFCSSYGHETKWNDDCGLCKGDGFYCPAKNKEELDEYLKRFDP